MARRIINVIAILFFMSAGACSAREVVTAFGEKDLPVLNDELRKVNETIEGLQEIHAFKSHRVASLTFSAPDTWHDVGFDTKVEEESAGTISYKNEDTISEDKTTIEIVDLYDIVDIQGCVRPLWTGAAGTSVVVATRIIYSEDGGSTWTEARCLQAVVTNSRAVDSSDTLPYSGTVRANGDILIKLQAQVSDTDMTFAGYPGFDRPVAATIVMKNIGIRR